MFFTSVVPVKANMTQKRRTVPFGGKGIFAPFRPARQATGAPSLSGHRWVVIVQPVHCGNAHFGDTNPRASRARTFGPMRTALLALRKTNSATCHGRGQIGGRYKAHSHTWLLDPTATLLDPAATPL